MAVKTYERLSFRDFKFFQKFIHDHAGIKLADSKNTMVYGRLTRRLDDLNLPDFKSYRQLLESREGEHELGHFINALTTNTTFLFREPHHFDHLKTVLETEIMLDSDPDKKFLLWSAGCSAGDEPYTIALVLKEVLKSKYGWTGKILATDLDGDILERAKRGVYTEEQVSKVPKKYFKDNFIEVPGGYTPKPDIKSMIHFKRLNLMDNTWPMKQKYNIIFCRNVTIYFTRETQNELVKKFHKILKPNGYLYLGHSETLMGVEDYYEPCGKTVYKFKKRVS